MHWFDKYLDPEDESHHQFNEWCRDDEFPDGRSDYQTGQQYNGAPTEDIFKTAVNKFNKLLTEGVIRAAHFNAHFPVTGSYKLGNIDSAEAASINTLHIGGQPPNCELVFHHIKINMCNIYWSGHTKLTDPVVFENCDFVKLTLNTDARVCLKNCKIGTLEITKVHQIHMEGGCVLNIQVAAPGNSNPLTGSVNFSNTFFPRNKFEYLLASAQPYRNMRHHLRAIENGHMANLFHSAELAVERADDSLLNKCISYAYEWLSDFGSSALRPLLWWLALYTCTVAVIFYSDGAVKGFENNDNFQGWREALIGNTPYYSDLLRANYLSLRSMINPLGLFGMKELIIPAHGWLVTTLSFIGLMSVSLITLFILAIRRRFKMQL